MKTSPARRVHAILKRAVDMSPRGVNTTIAMWARVLKFVPADFDGQIDDKLEDSILEALRALRIEVRAAVAQSSDPEVLEAIEPIAASVHIITQSNQLHSDWNNLKANSLRADLVSGWKWASIHLPSVEIEVTDDDLQELKVQLEELLALASSETLPAELRAFIVRQAKSIQAALRGYEVRGAGSLQEAMNSTVGDAIRESSLLQEASQSTDPQQRRVIAGLGKVWKKTAEICGDVDKFNKGFQALSKVTTILLPYVQDVV